jgi:hypothetical protein
VQVTDRPAGIGEVLLSNEDERALRHPSGGNLPLGVGDLFQRPT